MTIELVIFICFCSQNLSLDDNSIENILIIDYGMGTQGTQKLLYNIARLLKSKGHRVLIAHEPDKMLENLTKFGIESIPFKRLFINKVSRKLPQLFNSRIQKALEFIYNSYFFNKKEFKKYKIVILHNPLQLTSWIGWISGKKFVYVDGCHFWSNETSLRVFIEIPFIILFSLCSRK